jgi:GR25 family glycosyltransferase involved in LPS biosynthesis
MIFNNIERLFIFEDDCSFVNDFKDLYHKTLEMMKDKEYDILFLGYSGANVEINKDLHLLDHGVPRCLHAYVLTLSGAKKLVEKMSIIDYPIDEIIGRMFFQKELKGYRTSYILVYQPWQKREDKYPLPPKYINKYNDLI